MTIVQDHLVDQIGVDFAEACAELTRARLRRQQKDDNANRAAVAECHARIDVVLDLFLETRCVGRPADAGPHQELAPEAVPSAR